MDDQTFQLILNKLSRLEDKVDHLLEFKWKVVGIALAVGTIAGAVSRFI